MNALLIPLNSIKNNRGMYDRLANFSIHTCRYALRQSEVSFRGERAQFRINISTSAFSA